MKKKVEILAPAGSKESLLVAVSAGADAVYVGGERFGARAYAKNLTEEELLWAIDYVHLHGRKIYLTVNTLFKDSELYELYGYLAPYYERGLDAVIVQDTGAMEYIRKVFPALPIHVSTQATVTSAYGAEYYKRFGAERIVPARELNLKEIRQIKEDSGLEIECFVHGALCYCYSGQCLLSSMIGGRSGNRGQCAQPCRLPYSVNGGKKQDILSLKDLCTIEMLPELIDAGIDSFKIEGRMKQPGYVYTVVSMYRKYADLYLEHGRKRFFVSAEDRSTLEHAYRRRGYTDGYYRRHNGKEMLSLGRPSEAEGERVESFETKIKEKFNGKLILSQGERAKLYLFYKENSILCEGADVQEALKQPLERARVEKQMRKTGATEFEFESLDIVMGADVFLPMQALNELRRDAVAKLSDAVLKKYRRTLKETPDAEETADVKNAADAAETAPERMKKREVPELSALVSDEAHLKIVLQDTRIDTIYVDAAIADQKNVREILFDSTGGKGQKCGRRAHKIFLAMPYIFRKRQAEDFERVYESIANEFDGVLVRNMDTLKWLKDRGYSGEIRSDYNVYAFNRESKEILKKSGIDRFCAPCELNARELHSLGISEGTLIAYGHQPVMVTANCIRKNVSGCILKKEEPKKKDPKKNEPQKDGLQFLTDRYHKKFPVKNFCRYCYNVIYNCQPLVLLSQKEEMMRLAPAEIRMDFLAEGKNETERLIGLYHRCFVEHEPIEIPEDMDYTRGHFRRGVK